MPLLLGSHAWRLSDNKTDYPQTFAPGVAKNRRFDTTLIVTVLNIKIIR